MRRSRRRLLFPICAAAVLLAVAALTLEGFKQTSLLEHQAALVFEDSAAREARARLPDLEKAVEGAEASALEALLALPPDPPRDSVARVVASHSIIGSPFLLSADGSLAYPPPVGPPLAALAGDEPPSDEYLHARRLALNPSFSGEAMGALAAISSAPEVAGPFRLRARAALAALHFRAGRASEAAATYASIEADFPEELREIARPSKVEIAAARALALKAAGEIANARALVLRTFGEIEAAGPQAMGGDEAAILLKKAAQLLPDRAADPRDGDPAFPAALERFQASHASAARSLAFVRRVREWLEPRLKRGGERGRFSEDLEGERSIVSWARGRAGKGISAAGFLMNTRAGLEILESALRSGSAAESAGGPGLPLKAEFAGAPEGLKELAAFPASLPGFRVGLDRGSWERFLGAARRPFRIALFLEISLGLLLGMGAVLGWRVLRQEMFLARMKTEFVANVSHELKTPLALIRLFGETLLLDRVKEPSKAKEYFGIIARESERLTHLVNNILDFASLEAGRKTFDLRACDLGQVVEETFSAYRFQLEERGFQASLSVSEDLPETLADPEAVAQALINLLNNAVKYSPDRKEVAVKAESSGGAIRISVADRGMGIAPAERRRVFEDFYRSPAARRMGTRGSGLGLTLVRRILTAHGGSVELASALGEGSTFTMVFPVIAAARDGRDANPRGHIHEGK